MSHVPIDLQGYFPFFLGTISNRWTAASSREYLERFGIGIADWRVLASIYSLRSASSNEVVSLIFMDAGAVSRAMARLQELGLVQPVVGKFQGRTKPFEITAKGLDLYAEMQATALEREQRLLDGFSQDEREELLRLGRKMLANLSTL